MHNIVEDCNERLTTVFPLPFKPACDLGTVRESFSRRQVSRPANGSGKYQEPPRRAFLPFASHTSRVLHSQLGRVLCEKLHPRAERGEAHVGRLTLHVAVV